MAKKIGIFFVLFLVSISQSQPKEKISEWIQQLGNEDFEVREYAMRELKAIGKPALPALKQALSSKDPEVIWRVKAIIKAIEKNKEQKQSEQQKQVPDKKNDRSGYYKEYSWENSGKGYRFKFKYKRLTPKPSQEKQQFHYRYNIDQKQDLIVLENNIRYQFLWNNDKLTVTIHDFSKNTAKKHIVKDLTMLKQEHPHIYRIYKKNINNVRRSPAITKKRYSTEWEKSMRERIRRQREMIERLERLQRQRRRKIPDFKPSKYVEGIRVQKVSEAVKAQLGISSKEGLLVMAIDSRTGCLGRSALRKWDIILRVNNISVGSEKDLRQVLEGMEEKTGSISLHRRGKRTKILFVR